MGIERVLRENFESLGEVLAVEKVEDGQGNTSTGLTEEGVLAMLEPVMGDIDGLGGKVEVLAVNSGSGAVSLRYKGPQKLKLGVEIILKENDLVQSVDIKVVK